MIRRLTTDRLVPRWVRDLMRLLPVRSQFIFSGNIRDRFLIPREGGGYRLMRMDEALHTVLAGRGFELLLIYDPVDGIRVVPEGNDARALAEQLEVRLSAGYMPVSLENLMKIAVNVTGCKSSRVALLVDYASRIPTANDHLPEAEKRFFTAAEKLANSARPQWREEDGVSLFNPVIWLVNRIGDLPPWFSRDSERIHHVDIAKPDYDQRMEAVRLHVRRFSGYDDLPEQEKCSYITQFTGMTDGFTLQAIADVSQLAVLENRPIQDVDDAIGSFKAGDPALENPWRGMRLKQRIQEAERENRIGERVLGQPRAIKKAMDLLKRSAMGLTGAQASASFGRPRGVLFMAGPTGVGKTELAKALTEMVFGDERAYIRFDMSEFRSEHSDQRLLGAPPGYLGHDAGGELTNAVRRRPFSLILFDEIDKAHPRILDKFLQILEDGRLTDGRGETVYFSESIIAFTSNIGILEKREDGTVVQLIRPTKEDGSPTPYEEVESTVRQAIESFFTAISRPEILNRLGDNIVVFDFISPETGKEILQRMLRNIESRVRNEHGITIRIEEEPLGQLERICLQNLANGGRGIGSKLETALINPLANALFDLDLRGKETLTVTALHERDGAYYVTLQ